MMIQVILTAKPLVGHAMTPSTHGSTKHAKRHVKIAMDLCNHLIFNELVKKMKIQLLKTI